MKRKQNKIQRIYCIILFLFVISSILFSIKLSNADDQINVFFLAVSNSAPDNATNFYPQNESINISIPVTLEVVVYDNTSDTIDVYFYNATDDSLIGINYNVSTYGLNAGTASFIWSDLENNLTYRWYTISRDGEYNNTSDIWNFRTTPGIAPIIGSNIFPLNNSINVDLQITCHIEINDDDGHDMNIYWYENTSGDWILKQTNLSMSNGTYYWTFLNAINYSTTYYWKVVIDDGFYQTTKIYNLITKSNPYVEDSSETYPDFIYPPNRDPIATITGPYYANINETIIFYANQSNDPDGHIIGYRWDFNNDGIFDTDWQKDDFVSYIYSKTGNYTIKLIVRDGRGAETLFYHNITIIGGLQSPSVQINGPYYSYTHEKIYFNCTLSLDTDIEIIEYLWDFGDGITSDIKNPVHSYKKSGNYTVILKIRDDNNLTDITQTYVFIEQGEIRELPLLLPIIIIMAVISLISVLFLIKRKLNIK